MLENPSRTASRLMRCLASEAPLQSEYDEVLQAVDGTAWTIVTNLPVVEQTKALPVDGAAVIMVTTLELMTSALSSWPRLDTARYSILLIIGTGSISEVDCANCYRACAAKSVHDLIVKPGRVGIGSMEALRCSLAVSYQRCRRLTLASAPLKDQLGDMRVEMEGLRQRLKEQIVETKRFKDMFWTAMPCIYPTLTKLRKSLPDSVSAGTVVGDCQLGDFLGQGAFGRVFEAKPLNPKDPPRAVKVLDKSRIASISRARQICQELSLQKPLRHKSIAQLLEVVHGPEHIFIIMEFGGSTSLYRHLRKAERFELAVARSCSEQLLKGLAYCHSKNVAHRDLKPENITLSNDRSRLKLIDFGLAVHANSQCTDEAGTLPFIAPEVLCATADDPYYPAPADVWSTGVVILEMLCGLDVLTKAATGLKLVAGLDRQEHAVALLEMFTKSESVIRALLAKEQELSCRSELVELLEGLFILQPDERTPAQEAATSLWFSRP